MDASIGQLCLLSAVTVVVHPGRASSHSPFPLCSSSEHCVLPTGHRADRDAQEVRHEGKLATDYQSRGPDHVPVPRLSLAQLHMQQHGLLPDQERRSD